MEKKISEREYYLLRSIIFKMHLQKRKKNQHYLCSMMQDVMKVILKVILGIITFEWL